MKNRARYYASLPNLRISTYLIALGLMLLPISAVANPNDSESMIESWMTTPFVVDNVEPDLTLEDWMYTPFAGEAMELEVLESEIVLESWMSTPFLQDFTKIDTEGEKLIKSSIQQESAENDLQVEEWMVTPFTF